MTSDKNVETGLAIKLGLAGEVNMAHLCVDGVNYLFNLSKDGKHPRIARKDTAFSVRFHANDKVSEMYPEAPASVKELFELAIDIGFTMLDIGEHAALAQSLKQYQDVLDAKMPSEDEQVQHDANWVRTVSVVDPDSDMPVEMDVYKCNETGGLFGVDGSFLVGLSDNDPVNSPFNGELIRLLDEPKKERVA